ncbi:MAG: AAA family ATPase [Candidatus Woesearchaeota archaeon]
MLDFPKKKISMIFGPAATGKTTLCMQLSLKAAENKKVLFVDTEGGFSTDRLKQMKPDFEKELANILVYRAKNFDEQVNFLNNIEEITKNGDFGLIIIDTIGMQYRKALQDGDYGEVNKRLLLNLRKLTHVAEDLDIPIIMTNQVYSNMEGEQKYLGGKMVLGFAKFLVELKKEPRKAVILKPEEKILKFKIEDSGLVFG